ncbi:MAG: HAMP domain-containing histidine kinase [Saprospiraceae bacterium]|nr:HAMP domain-containing histidine kinase [Saprospiraceae bacterium]
MNFYQRKGAWKVYMLVAGVLTMIVVMLYTSFLATNLRIGERNKVELLVKAYEDLAKDMDDVNRDVTFSSDIIERNRTIPLIMLNEQTNEVTAQNFPNVVNENDIWLELEKIRKNGGQPIIFEGEGTRQSVYYKESTLLTYITYFPYVILLFLLAFMGMGYLGLSSARQAEQNRVWVGMAKETAHQLGTPISAIVAWIEHLRGMSEDKPDQLEILDELTNDVARLDLIADRFSKIGSAPNLESKDIYRELEKAKIYMQRRASRRVKFQFPDVGSEPKYVNINAPLFNWVMENLLRNALDAMDGEGLIKAEVYEDHGMVAIDVSDTGKGIPSSKQKTVFQPGFTTKKRGWGLGLSLAKRIIEEYHEGKIFVKHSEQNHGTTFTIKLPKGEEKTKPVEQLQKSKQFS